MKDLKAWMTAICAEPDEDTPRLAFADWLEENGRPERAEGIRSRVAGPALRRGGRSDGPVRAAGAGLLVGRRVEVGLLEAGERGPGGGLEAGHRAGGLRLHQV